MSDNGKITPVEAHDNLTKRIAEEAKANEDASAGFYIPGEGRYYPGEYDFDLNIKECPDTIPTNDNFEIDAMLVMGQRHKQTGKLRASTLKRFPIRNAVEFRAMREARGINVTSYNMNKMREDYGQGGGYPDPFAYGVGTTGGGGGALSTYIPAWPGPVTRQLYWQDYFGMSAKAFEAYNHDPVSWRCVHMKQEFTLGKGLSWRITYSSGGQNGQTHDQATQVWEEFWKRNKMDIRMDMLARDLSWCGEQFLRYFCKGKMTTVRSLDPASIFDIITDPEDFESIFAYHQQFQTAYQLYAPTGSTPATGPAPTGPTMIGATTRYIIRQILPNEIDHYRINQSAFERRGRSDLFPALGWIKRMREYLISHVIRADMLSRICWDLVVEGNLAAITNLRGLLFPNGQAPPPGSVFGHNKASTLTALVPQGGGGGETSRGDPMLDALVTMVSISIGLPKDWLGFGMQATRAGALVATEPAAQSLGELQGTEENILHDCFDRVMATAKITNAEVEFTFPSIASEDRTQLLQDLSYSESNMWISKQTAASIAAKNLGITNYNYEQEMSTIAAEFDNAYDEEPGDPNPITGEATTKPVQGGDGKIRRPLISGSNIQVPKLDPTKAQGQQEDEAAGLLVPAMPAGAPGAPGAAPEDQAPGMLHGAAATTAAAAAVAKGQPVGLLAQGAAKSAAGLPGASAGTQAGKQSPPTRQGAPADENPLSAAGAKNIKGDLKEGEPVFTASMVAQMLEAQELVMAAAMREGGRSDAAFRKASEKFRRETQDNLRELVVSTRGADE